MPARKSSRPVVQIEGLAELRKRFGKLSDDVAAELRDTVAVTQRNVVAGAKARAPRRTGQLAAAITVAAVTEKGGNLRGGVGIESGPAEKYWAIIEFGWPARGIAPQPFLYPAAESERDAHRERVSDAVAALVSRANTNA
jgi:HK97 gp10 family phage protein